MLTILQGDCRETLKSLPADSVQCVVTSPPYWGLRSYLIDGHEHKEKELGSESTPEEFVENMIAVFREVRRVLRPDGTLWLNLGDCHSNNGKWGGASSGKNAHSTEGGFSRARKGSDIDPKRKSVPGAKQPLRGHDIEGLKPKDLVGIPWRVAFALQADGWYLRQWMPWVKRNSMPESTADRPTTTCETFFLLTKSQRYFYDGEAVKMPASPNSHARMSQNIEAQIASERANGGRKTNGNMKAVGKIAPAGTGPRNNDSFANAVYLQVGDRNRRNGDWFFDSDWQGMLTDDDGWPVAMVVNPQPFKGAHFATYPPKLVVPCILAGTSARGCCPTCGAPWERIVEKGEPNLEHQRACGGDANGQYDGQSTKDYAASGAQDASATKARILAGMTGRTTVRWEPTCTCFHLPGHVEPVPCTVLDPFLGSGTTAQVAIEHGRQAIGGELNAEYVPLIKARCTVTAGLRLA